MEALKTRERRSWCLWRRCSVFRLVRRNRVYQKPQFWCDLSSVRLTVRTGGEGSGWCVCDVASARALLALSSVLRPVILLQQLSKETNNQCPYVSSRQHRPFLVKTCVIVSRYRRHGRCFSRRIECVPKCSQPLIIQLKLSASPGVVGARVLCTD